eukprot:COSAG02_NODE_179_length_31090_cov_49.813785_12_plen_123_part_00
MSDNVQLGHVNVRTRLVRTVRDVACEMSRQAWCISIATIEDLNVVTTTAAVNLVVVVERVTTQPVCATLQVHLGEVNVYSLTFRGSDADTAVKVVSTACEAKHSVGRQSGGKTVYYTSGGTH